MTSMMEQWSCPPSLPSHQKISLSHGAGGRLSHDLIRDLFGEIYAPGFAPDHDGAVLNLSGRTAFTTDSFVVKPLTFPGGDIGQLAVFGTVNDLAMCGARPLYISTSWIIEEGFPIPLLRELCHSMRRAAEEAQVGIVTGDTKTVARGHGDGLFINTTGLGWVAPDVEIHPRHIEVGDQVILTGDVGRHAISVLAARQDLGIGLDLTSDCAPLHGPIQAVLDAGVRPHAMRDLTRGGLVAALHEMAQGRSFGFELDESRIMVRDEVRGVCEILGLDPLTLAGEGCAVLMVPPPSAQVCLDVLREWTVTKEAALIGEVTAGREVMLRGPYGGRRSLPFDTGEGLPRIC